MYQTCKFNKPVIGNHTKRAVTVHSSRFKEKVHTRKYWISKNMGLLPDENLSLIGHGIFLIVVL